MRKFGLLALLIPAFVWAASSVNSNRGATTDPKGVSGASVTNTQLLLDYSSATQFTYTSTDVEFSAGAARLASQYSSSVVFAANFASSLNGVYSKNGGVLTATVAGTTAVTSGKADLSIGTSYKDLTWAGSSNFPHDAVGAVRFHTTPNYSGTPSTAQWYWMSGGPGDLTDAVFMEHHTDGVMYYYVYNSTTGNIAGLSFAWAPTAGQQYEFYFYWDTANGDIKAFIDGVQKVASVATGTRDNRTTYFRIGGYFDSTATAHANFKIDDLVLYSAVQESTGYTPGYTVSSTKYVTTDPTVLQTSGVAIATLVGISGGTTAAGSDSAKFCLYNGTTNVYYNSGWTSNATCDPTHSSTLATLNTNAATLTAATYQVRAVLHSNDGSTTPSVSSVSLTYR